MMLEVENLVVRYGHAEPSVKGISLTLDRGQVLSIVGESGSGKTTVIRAILGCLPPNASIAEGDMRFEGQSLKTVPEEEYRRMRGTEMAMIFQDCGSMLDPIQTAGRQFVEHLQLHGTFTREEAWAKACNLCTQASLRDPDDILNKYPFELSGGQRQRVGIAMGLAFNPKLLLADEPTAALDVTTQAQVAKELMSAKERTGMAIIMVTHNISMAAHLSDYIIVMQNGEVVEEGNAHDVLHHPQHPYTKSLVAAVPMIGGARYVG